MKIRQVETAEMIEESHRALENKRSISHKMSQLQKIKAKIYPKITEENNGQSLPIYK